MFRFLRSKRRRLKRVGLALGSGSARGWAHIGVIRALTDAGIRVEYVAGTSIGALVGAVYSSGGIDDLESVILQLDWKKILLFFDIVFPKSGLIDGKKVADFVRKYIKENSIDELPIPFCAVATNLTTGEEETISSGGIIEAVRASISVPGVFTPVRKDHSVLVDGGLVNPVPISVARRMGADFVIAIDLNHDIVSKKVSNKISTPGTDKLVLDAGTNHKLYDKFKILHALSHKLTNADLPDSSQIKKWKSREPLPNIFEVLLASTTIMEAQITQAKLKTDPPDLLIQPKLGHIKFLEFNRAREAIDEGYRATKTQIEHFLGKGGKDGLP